MVGRTHSSLTRIKGSVRFQDYILRTGLHAHASGCCGVWLETQLPKHCTDVAWWLHYSKVGLTGLQHMCLHRSAVASWEKLRTHTPRIQTFRICSLTISSSRQCLNVRYLHKSYSSHKLTTMNRTHGVKSSPLLCATAFLFPHSAHLFHSTTDTGLNAKCNA